MGDAGAVAYVLERALALADAPSSYITDTMFVWRGLPITVGSVGAGRRDLRGVGSCRITGDCRPGGTAIAAWKFGRRSSGGMSVSGGGGVDMADRCVLVDVWLRERFSGRLMKAL